MEVVLKVTKLEKLFCDYKYKEVSVLHPNMNTKGTVNNVTLCRKYVLLEYSKQKPDPPLSAAGKMAVIGPHLLDPDSGSFVCNFSHSN